MKNKSIFLINTLVFITVLSIPLYFLRIDIASVSISLLTLNLLILNVVLLLTHLHYNTSLRFSYIFKKESLFWIFSILFLLSFVPSLLLNPSVHGLGVFVEWITLPIITSFLLLTHSQKNPEISNILQTSLTVTLFLVSSVSLIYLFFGQITFDGRLNAFYSSPNHLAMLITPLTFIACAQFFSTSSKFIKYFSLFSIIISSVILFFTNSLTSSLALAVSLGIILFLQTKNKLKLSLIGLALILLIFSLGYIKFTNIDSNLKRSSIMSRYEIWTVATDHIQQNSLSSPKEIDSFQNIYLDAQPFYTPYLNWSAPTPHNILLTLWVSGGFFSVLFFCLLSVRWLFISFFHYHKNKKATTLLYIAAFLTILFTGFFDTSYWKNDLALIFWILLSLNLFPTTSISR